MEKENNQAVVLISFRITETEFLKLNIICENLNVKRSELLREFLKSQVIDKEIDYAEVIDFLDTPEVLKEKVNYRIDKNMANLLDQKVRQSVKRSEFSRYCVLKIIRYFERKDYQ